MNTMTRENGIRELTLHEVELVAGGSFTEPFTGTTYGRLSDGIMAGILSAQGFVTCNTTTGAHCST